MNVGFVNTKPVYIYVKLLTFVLPYTQTFGNYLVMISLSGGKA